VLVELCYRERSQSTRSRYPSGPVHLTLPGAPRLLCDANAYVDTQHRPAVNSTLTCKRCLRLVDKGEYQLPDGQSFTGDTPVVASLRLGVVIPWPLAEKLIRVSTARGLPYSKTMLQALYELPDVPGAASSVSRGTCTHPGQKVNQPRDVKQVDRVCQACHIVIETLPRCPKQRANGQQCRGFTRPGYATCSAHARKGDWEENSKSRAFIERV
jgi:hypothetical protein